MYRRVKRNGNLLGPLRDAYLAYEALTDHPYGFSSVVHGFFPLVTSCDGGCTKLETENCTLDKFLAQREKQTIDVDLGAEWLALSMLSPMLFSKRLQLVYSTPLTFCPDNRKSNVFVLDARGPVPGDGDVEEGDGFALCDFVQRRGRRLIDLLSGMTLADMAVLYRRCFDGGKGLSR